MLNYNNICRHSGEEGEEESCFLFFFFLRQTIQMIFILKTTADRKDLIRIQSFIT